jgi:alpha-tubulin suppressor-like RCC1 family protein
MRVPWGDEIDAVATGYDITCASNPSGIECAGNNLYEGVLPSQHRTESKPLQAPGLGAALEIAAGDYHVCARTSSTEDVLCWGDKGGGQKGEDPAVITSTGPRRVLGTAGTHGLAANGDSTCVLDASGDVLCWGRNSDGQLGIGNNSTVYGVQKVLGLPPGGAIQVATGTLHNCALTASNQVWCWGYNHDGMLGDGTISQGQSTPVRVPEVDGALEVACGGHHTCVRMSDGSVLCFGRNDEGQLGDGTLDSRPQPAPMAGVHSATRLSLREDTTCVLLASGEVTCAGTILGNEPSTNAAPTLVGGLANIVELRLGTRHACAIDSSHQLFCWGSDIYGQLGLGSVVWYSDPVQLNGL